MSTLIELLGLNADGLFPGPRIPRPAPADQGIDHDPGHICWGAVGSLPSAQLAPSEGFEVVNCNEQHVETQREFEQRKIASEDDPDTFILVDRVKKLYMKKTENTTGPKDNAGAAVPEGFGDFAPSPIELTSFKPLGTENQKKCKYTITLNTNDDKAI